jgi:hypothetical protein
MSDRRRGGLERELYAAAQQETLDEAFTALAKVAKALGVFDLTQRAISIEEVGELICAEAERLRALQPAVIIGGREAVQLGQQGLTPDTAAALVLGAGPWTVRYQLADRNGRVIAGSEVGPLVSADDKVRIEFGVTDIRVALG